MQRLVRPGVPGRVVAGLAQILRDSFFQYAINFTFVGNENQQLTIPIQNDAHFLCVQTQYDTNVAAGVAGAAFGGTLVQLKDGGSNRDLQNTPVPASSLFGNAQRPYWWPLTHLFRANTFIGVSATGIAAATAQIVRYVFSGYKVPLNDPATGVPTIPSSGSMVG